MMELDFLQGTPAANARAEATAKRMMSGGRAIRLADGSTLHATVDAERPDAAAATLRLSARSTSRPRGTLREREGRP